MKKKRFVISMNH